MLNWRASWAVGLSAGFLMLLTVEAQRNSTSAAADAAALTAMDYIEIKQLVARYPHSLDAGAGNGYAFADLFAPDGAFISASRGKIEGREQLAMFGRSVPKSAYPRRFTMNHVIQPSPEGATGKQYVVELSIGANGEPGGDFTSVGGRYEDVYTKTPQGWRFKRREFISSKMGPQPAQTVTPVTPVPARVQDRGTSASTLTPQDYVEIEQLAIRYAYALDTGANNGYMYADVFTTDGEFIGRQVPFTQGRERLAAVARSVRRANPLYVRHFVTSHLIEPSPEGATGKVYLAVIDIAEDGKPGGSIYIGGHYEDVYVKTAEGWRIKRRDARAMGPPRTPGLQ